jgi:hypothetical protein
VSNIMSAIENLTEKKGYPMESFYEGLSEHSHPNAPAMVLLYTDKHENGVTFFTDRNEGRARASMILAIMALATSLDVLHVALQNWDDARTPFVQIVERHVYEEGKWPAGIEFPINRGEGRVD